MDNNAHYARLELYKLNKYLKKFTSLDNINYLRDFWKKTSFVKRAQR